MFQICGTKHPNSNYYFQTLQYFMYGSFVLLFILILSLNKFFMNEELRSLRLLKISTAIVLSLRTSIQHLSDLYWILFNLIVSILLSFRFLPFK